ncbi:class I SAM-dependent methyltransferase [Baaleninema simplex]|uniref:class I SAM-dependent methyltransferase n=1 Tax=Baaleninema simplex TaxID=2862350 RepID=UPI00034BA5CF|nr:methyltransferase domain-containing protein [Baaleninema simplex]
MSLVEEKLAKSLTARSTKLIPYLPYLLQDLWELGSIPKDVISLASRHIDVSKNTQILDLGCGKGAVSISLARTFGCQVKGIDMIPEFIEFSRNKAKEYRVEHLCKFKIEDINRSIQQERNYDLVVFSSVGDVLGNWNTTLLKLKKTIKQSGYILIDEGFFEVENNEDYPTKERWLEIFRESGVKRIDEIVLDDCELANTNQKQQSYIVKRANELKQKHPDKSDLFESYIQSQQAECDELERDMTGVTWLLQAI